MQGGPLTPAPPSGSESRARGGTGSCQPATLGPPTPLPHCPDARAVEPAAAHPTQKQRDMADHGGCPMEHPDHLGGEEGGRGPGETGLPGMPTAAFLHAPAGATLEACQDGPARSEEGRGSLEEQESARAVPSAFTRVTVPEGAMSPPLVNGKKLSPSSWPAGSEVPGA